MKVIASGLRPAIKTATVIGLLVLLSTQAFAKPRGKASELVQDVKEQMRKELKEELQAEQAKQQSGQAEEEKDPFEGLPQTGVLASYGAGVGSMDVGGFGGVGITEDSKAPLTASVNKDGNRWKVTLVNRSEKNVSALVYLKQFDKDGRKVKSSPVSFSLSPQSETQRFVNSFVGSSQVTVELANWKAK